MSYTISKAGFEDIEDISRLVNSAYRGDTSRKGWTTEADLLDGSRVTTDLLMEILAMSDTTILKYKENNILLGCVELKKDNEKAYLGMLTVEPTHQGSGIGKKLLYESERWARNQGCQSIYMTVISNRTELINWYLRHGYGDNGMRKPFEMPDARWGIPKRPLQFVVLEKQISNRVEDT